MEWVYDKNRNKKFRWKNLTRIYFDASFQGVRTFSVLALNDTTFNDDDNNYNPINNTNDRVVRDSHKKYFLPRVNIIN